MMKKMNKDELIKKALELKDKAKEKAVEAVKEVKAKKGGTVPSGSDTQKSSSAENEKGKNVFGAGMPKMSSKPSHTFDFSLIKERLGKKGTDKDDGKSEEEKKDDRRFYIKCAGAVLVIAVVLGVYNSNFKLEKSVSESMEPTIMVGDYGFLYKKAYKNSTPKNGDMIVFKYNGETGGKRVMGTPGDTITFKDGYVYRNGKKVNEDYLPSDDTETNCIREFKVPADSVFVLGDNREVSYDSRFWKHPYVSYSDIKGKILFVIPAHYFSDKQ